MKNGWIAHHDETGEEEYFDTFDDAKKWLDEMYEDYGFSNSTLNGSDYIENTKENKIFKSKVEKTDFRKDYECARGIHEFCSANCEDETDECDCPEYWPHLDDFEWVGEVSFEDES